MINERAIVLTKKIGVGVQIGPFAFVDEEVELGDGCWVGPHAVIKGCTKLGKGNKVFQFASIGEVPQDKKYRDEKTLLEIGDNNVFRENTTVHIGTINGQGKTLIGNDNLFMVGVHVAHDCIIGNHTIFANCATLAGHVKIEDYVILGGFTKIAQFVTVGEHAFLIGDSSLNKDVLPFVLAGGPKDRLYGLNVIGLKRFGFSSDTIQLLKEAYDIIVRKGLSVEDALIKLEGLADQNQEVKKMKVFLEQSVKGILRE